jgi:uncharacterized coiled-coil protein SlyX
VAGCHGWMASGRVNSIEYESLMDKHFLEFWGNFLLNAARGQKQLEEMAKWMQQGFTGFENLNEMFRKCYGFDENIPDDSSTREKAQADFQKSFNEYLSLFGVVPREEHLALVKKYEELRQRVAAQEETIRHLRMLMEEKGFDQSKLISGLQELMVEQGEQFRRLMASFSDLYNTGKNDS